MSFSFAITLIVAAAYLSVWLHRIYENIGYIGKTDSRQVVNFKMKDEQQVG
jgi:hypothetical protein